MQSQLVFQEEKERERLRRQNLLLSQAEKPALEHFFKGKVRTFCSGYWLQ